MTKVTDWGADTAEMYFLMILEAGRLRPRRGRGWALLRPLSLACKQPSSMLPLTWSFFCVRACPGPHLLFLEDPQSLWVQFSDLILTLIVFLKDRYLQIQS